jgi:ABC-2 type transport system permease protein
MTGTRLVKTGPVTISLMNISLMNITAAEVGKLRTLPVAVMTAIGTAVIGALIAAALTAQLVDQGLAASASSVTAQAVPFLQIGLILLGVLPMAHEYAGGQLRTTLTTVPRRGLLLAGKGIATLLGLALAASAAVGGVVATTELTRRLLDAPPAEDPTGPWPVAGAAAYLVLVGLLAHAVALLVRHLIPALVGMLSLVLIVSPLLAGLTRHARWLPDRAAMQLYGPADTVLTAATGTLVMLAWITLVGGTAAVLFVRRDP